MATESSAVQGTRRLPFLEAGDHLDQRTFHQRYKAMPSTFRAELIGGVVFVPSPLSWGHGHQHAFVMAWLVHYEMATPGTQAGDNATTVLGETSEPQPDGALLIDPAAGGQTRLSEDGYTTGPPELTVEIASSSASIDLHAKRRDYEQAGVREYVVVVLRQQVVRWFVWQEEGATTWLSTRTASCARAFFQVSGSMPRPCCGLDGAAVMEVLRQGLATPEHAAFVQRLQGR